MNVSAHQLGIRVRAKEEGRVGAVAGIAFLEQQPVTASSQASQTSKLLTRVRIFSTMAFESSESLALCEWITGALSEDPALTVTAFDPLSFAIPSTTISEMLSSSSSAREMNWSTCEP